MSLFIPYCLHVKSPFTEDVLFYMHSIWLMDLAGSLPKPCQLDGFDVADGNYPAKKYWPDNVNLAVLDAFGDVPEDLVGRYDVVHLRFWAAMVKNRDPKPLIRHALKLLSMSYLHPDLLIRAIVILGTKLPSFHLKQNREDTSSGRNSIYTTQLP